MPRLVLAAVLSMTLVPSPAAARPDATRMTCAEATATGARAGGVVLSTGGVTYKRFVSSAQFCDLRQQTEPGYALTRDVPQCQVGYVCKTPEWLERN